MKVVRGCLALALLIGLWSGSGWTAQLKVQEATLHVGAPADIVAVTTPEGSEATFDLPAGLVLDSVQATQGGAVVSPVFQPILEQGDLHPQIARYQVRLAGLQPGVPVEVRFRTNDLRWTPAVSLRVVNGEGNLQVQGSLVNQSLDLTGAKLRLVTGRVGEGYAGPAELYESGWDPASYQQMMAELGRDFSFDQGGLQTVAELEKLDLPVASTRQAPLLAAKFAVTRTYRWDTQQAEEHFGGPRPQRASTLYSFVNTSGRALPEGKVTVSEGDAVIGSGYMPSTPAGQTALVAVPSVQGISVKRRESNTPQPRTWETEHKVTLRAESGRTEQIVLHVSEQAPGDGPSARGESERVYDFSETPQERTKGAFVWDLTVPAHGAAEVSYSYREPINTAALRLLSFTANGAEKERQYLVEAPRTSVGVSRNGHPRRTVQADGYMLYRLPVPKGVDRVELVARLANAFRVSLAPEVNGKPGPFAVVADAIAISGRAIRNGRTNFTSYYFDLTPFLSATGRAVYLRIADPTLEPGEGNGAFLRTIEVIRLPEGFPSRAPKYPTRVDPKPATAP